MNLINLLVNGVLQLVNAYAIETVREIRQAATRGTGKPPRKWDCVLDSGKRISVEHDDLPALLEEAGVSFIKVQEGKAEAHVAALGVESIIPVEGFRGETPSWCVHTGSGAVLNVCHDDLPKAVNAAAKK